jgi:exonuclease V gamma subunit
MHKNLPARTFIFRNAQLFPQYFRFYVPLSTYLFNDDHRFGLK